MLKSARGDSITLVEHTWKGIGKSCWWTDNEIGSWYGYAYNVLENKSSHPFKSKILSKKTCLERYGTTNPAQSPLVKAKIAKTNMRIYGAPCVFGKESSKRKQIKQTSLNRYGTEYPQASKRSRDNAKKTNLKCRGVENVFACSIVKQTIKETNMKRYGVEWNQHDPVIKARQESTNLKRYGNINPAKNDLIKSKISNRLRDLDVRERHHATMKSRNRYGGKSMIEDRFYEILKLCFLKIERQVLVNGWSIDFYIDDIDTYVQFDGVYWHGLDRNIDDIKKNDNKRDRTILRTMEIDVLQRSWFNEQNLKLIRITDKEFKKFGETSEEINHFKHTFFPRGEEMVS